MITSNQKSVLLSLTLPVSDVKCTIYSSLPDEIFRLFISNKWSFSQLFSILVVLGCLLLNDFMYLYRPKRSFGQGNIFTPVCHSVHRGGVWQGDPPGWMENPPWLDGEPPRLDGEPPRFDGEPPGWMENPPPRLDGEPPRLDGEPPRLDGEPPLAGRRTPPGSRLRHSVYDRPVRIRLECILVSKVKSYLTFLLYKFMIVPIDNKTTNCLSKN